jgi:hypothetical protein
MDHGLLKNLSNEKEEQSLGELASVSVEGDARSQFTNVPT